MRLFIFHEEGPEDPAWDFRHTDVSLDDLFETENVVVSLRDLEYTESCKRMRNPIEKYQNTDTNVYILTGNYCDAAQAPCGCYGFDSQCDWHVFHRRYDEPPDFLEEFAGCMCSDKYKTKCSYHNW
jgi:hypothetical protein